MTSHTCLPREWVDRLFAVMSCTYGRKFADMWAGQDAEMVKAVWAEKLGGFRDRPESIKYAIGCLEGREWPPTLPEFLADCRRAPKPAVAALEYKPSDEDMARNRERARKMAEALGRRMAA